MSQTPPVIRAATNVPEQGGPPEPLAVAPVIFECPRHQYLKVLRKGTKGEDSEFLRFQRGVLITDNPADIAQLSANHIRNRYGVHRAEHPARTYTFDHADGRVATFRSQAALSVYQKLQDKGASVGYVGWND